MKKSKLFITILLCVTFIFCFAFVACSPNSENPDGNGKQEESYVNPSWKLSGKTKDYYIVNADGTLTTSFELEDVEVEFGTNLFLTLPIVIDGKANVLNVSYTVQDNAGIEVDLVGGAFYAMSGTGYSVKYTVKGVDGKTKTFGNNIKVIGADQMYVGEDFIIELENLTQVKKETLIKLTAQNTFDLTTLLSAEQLENVQKATTTDGVEVKWKVASKNTGTVELDSTQLDFSVFPKANYVVYVQAFVGETSQILFADVVDFYDTTEDFTYGEWSNIVHEKIDANTLINTVQDTTVTEITDNSTETVLSGRTEKFYKVDSINGSKSYNFSFNPLHSKKYYETYLDANVNISFEMYVTAEKLAGETNEILGVFGTTTGKLNGSYYSGRCQFPANKWNKIEMPLEVALNGSMCSVESLFYVNGNTANAQSSTVYFGNFKVTQDVNSFIESDESLLIDLKDAKSYNVSEIIGSQKYNEYQTINAKYELVAFNTNKVYTLENGQIDFNTVPYGAYSLAVKSGGLMLYAVNVDFYNSNNAPVYNDRLAKEYAFGYRATVGTSQNQQNRERIYGIIESVTLNEPNHNGNYIRLGKNAQTPQSTIDGGGTWGTPLAFNVMAVHSKEYYELYQNYEVQFEYYINSSTTVATPFASTATSMTAGWYTAKISVIDILAKWDILHDNVETEGYGNNLFTTSFAWPRDEYYAYIGNFSMELKPIETDGATLLLNVKDMDGINVDELLSQEDYNSINGDNLVWSITPACSTSPYLLTDGAINFDSVPYGAYVLQGKTSGGKVVYLQNVDFYNSDTPEYNNVVSTDYVWGYRPLIANSVNSETERVKNTVEVVTLTETGHKGNYYATLGTSATAWLGTVLGYNVKSNHSKEYFELYKDYTVTFEYYLGDTKDSVSIYVATSFADAIPDKTAYGGDPFVGWYTAEIPVTTILEKWNVITQTNLDGVTGYANTMLSQNLNNSNNYTYFGNFKLEKIETLPQTASETPAYNIVSRSAIDDVWVLRSNSLTDGYYHSNGQKKLNVVEFTESDPLLGKTSGKYYSFDGTIVVSNSTYYFGVAPYYEKSVYETYLTANPDAVMSFEFCSVQEGITNNIRRAWINALKNTTNYANYLEVGKWYTVTIPLKYVVDNFDAMSTAGSSWLISYEAFDNRYTANGTQDTTLTATQPIKAMMYFGNFTISASGTVGVYRNK